jgi:hypothetical protein
VATVVAAAVVIPFHVALISCRHFERMKTHYPEFKNALREIASGKSDKLADLVSEGCIL